MDMYLCIEGEMCGKGGFVTGEGVVLRGLRREGEARGDLLVILARRLRVVGRTRCIRRRGWL